MKKYNVYISRIHTYSSVVEADSYDEALEKASEIADELLTENMEYGDEIVEISERRECYGKESFG